MGTAAAVRRVTRDVLREFAEDGVRYVELRTTPKALPDGTTAEGYVAAVLEEMRAAEQAHPIVARLLLSVDRARPLEQARDTVRLAARLAAGAGAPHVVGVDLSGNPQAADAADLVPILADARAQGLKLALHVAEISSRPDDTAALMALPPDRVGHGSYLDYGPGPASASAARALPPIEVCLTSNLHANMVESAEVHHIHDIVRHGVPFAICTDDKGVFATSLSWEYTEVARLMGWTRSDLRDIARRALDHAFLSEDERRELAARWWE